MLGARCFGQPIVRHMAMQLAIDAGVVLREQAGLRPGGRLTCSLLRQRKVSKRKASRLSGPLVRFPALLAPRGVWLNSLRSDNASPDPLAPALLGPATRRVETKTKAQANQYAPWRVLVGFVSCPHHPCGRAEQRSRAGWPRKGACLSQQASLRHSPAVRAAQVAWSAAQGRGHRGRLSFAYVSLARQRNVGRPPGRVPACWRRTRPVQAAKCHRQVPPLNAQRLPSVYCRIIQIEMTQGTSQTVKPPAHRLSV